MLHKYATNDTEVFFWGGCFCKCIKKKKDNTTLSYALYSLIFESVTPTRHFHQCWCVYSVFSKVDYAKTEQQRYTNIITEAELGSNPEMIPLMTKIHSWEPWVNS